MLRFEAFGPARVRAPFLPPPGMRLQEYVLAYDEGRRSTVYLVAHAHGAAFGDAYLFDGKAWVKVAQGKTTFGTTQKLGGFYDEARAGIATWNFEHDYDKHRYVATSLLFDVRNGLSPIPASGDDPLAELDGDAKTGTFDYMGLFAPDPRRAVTVCLTRRGVWELDADAVWRKRADHDDAFPTAWDDDGAGAAFDPVRRRPVFWLYTRKPHREYAFFVWDGKTLARMPAEGLPMKRLHIGLFDPAALIAAHPEHGIVVLAGDAGMFAFDGTRWNELPSPHGDVPPRMKNGRMIYDGNVRGFVVGPGYHEGDPGGQEQQRVFYVERAGAWGRMGVRSVPSKLKELWPQARHVNARGVWYAIATGDLQTLRWRDTDFVELAPKSELLEGQRVEAAVDARGTPMAITNRGAVFAFEEGKWARVHAAWKPFGDRSAISAAWDVAGERLVVWADGETFFFTHSIWEKSKKRSPAPKDADADFILRYDGALKRVLRFGTDVAMLENDAWTHVAAPRYGKLCGPRAWEHFPAHDAKTGETVLVNLERRAVVRFDVSGCADVDTIEMPEDANWSTFRDTLSFERSTRLVHVQSPDRSSHRFALDLGPAFDAARSLGPRKVPAHVTLEVAAVGARLYHPKKKTFWFLEGDLAHGGPIGEEGTAEKVADAAAAIAAKRKAGFVPTGKLPVALLAQLGARKSRALRIGKKTTAVKPGTSHVGGLPSIAPKAWPKSMGFVVQMDAHGLLRKHGGVAIFGDGTAFEAIVVTAAQWKKKPAPAPKGVAVVPPLPITIGPACFELDEARVQALAEKDSAMTGAFERFAKRSKMQMSTSKLGGNPIWVREAEIPVNYTFFGQVELDDQRILVFVDADEKNALVIAQRY